MRFEFATATRILFGNGTVKEVARAAKEMGQRALVVTGSSPGTLPTGCMSSSSPAAFLQSRSLSGNSPPPAIFKVGVGVGVGVGVENIGEQKPTPILIPVG